jgi:hypothetical protein
MPCSVPQAAGQGALLAMRENRTMSARLGLNIHRLIKGPLGQSTSPRVIAATLLTAGAVVGWALSAIFTANAIAQEHVSVVAVASPVDLSKPADELKPNLVGSYQVIGTDSDGKPYAAPGIVAISLAPSGALELEWDNGKQVGVGQVVGNVLAVACLTKGRTAILVMNINPDGSLSGAWSRRTDRGYKGTERWKKA